MPCKSFNVCVVLRLSDITCPGVCLCPTGAVYLEITLFGCNSCTLRVKPKFPLVIDETFSFHQIFADATNLKDVQKCLEEKSVRMALVQVYKKKQVTLATYRSSVDEFLYPDNCRSNKYGETALLMKNEPIFPGTISPKITLVTKTSITQQIKPSTIEDRFSSHDLKTQNCPNRMKRVHHTKCFHKGDHRVSSNESSDSDSDTDCQLYCQKSVKTRNVADRERHFNGSCKQCEDINLLKIPNQKNESSNNKILKSKHTCLNDNDYKTTELTSKKIDSSTNESIRTSDDDFIKEEKNIRRPEFKLVEDNGVEPRKINPKIKAQLNLGLYNCKCETPRCVSSPSWRNICCEINRKDTIGDTIKYHVSLRNYYRRLYDGVTYQLSRNLRLL